MAGTGDTPAPGRTAPGRTGTGVRASIAVSAGAVLVCGALIAVALVGDEDGDAPTDGAGSAPTDGITGFDFANARMDDGSGTPFRLVDGFHQAPGQPDTVGYHLVGEPAFADVDGDGDLDAATLLEWTPSAGASTTVALVWLWQDGTARQLDHPIRTDQLDRLSDLVAVDGGFRLTAHLHGRSGDDEAVETFTVGFADGFPVQIAPVLGSVNRCPLFPGEETGRVGDGTVPLVAPDSAAPPVGTADDISTAVAVPTDVAGAGWTVVRVTHTDGAIACGWLPDDHLIAG